MILGDKPFIFEVVLSQRCYLRRWSGRCGCFRPLAADGLLGDGLQHGGDAVHKDDGLVMLEAEQRWRLIGAWATAKRSGGV
jgi:hypothetical protein